MCPFCGSDMVFSVDQPETKTIEESSATSSSSSHSGSDVIVAPNEPYSPRTERADGGSSDDSEEGSVEVMDKKTQLFTTMVSSPASGGLHSAKKAPKSCSSRSASSKSSSHASRSNRSGVSSPSFSFSYADFSQVA